MGLMKLYEVTVWRLNDELEKVGEALIDGTVEAASSYGAAGEAFRIARSKGMGSAVKMQAECREIGLAPKPKAERNANGTVKAHVEPVR